jgi:hypothetical protein
VGAGAGITAGAGGALDGGGGLGGRGGTFCAAASEAVARDATAITLTIVTRKEGNIAISYHRALATSAPRNQMIRFKGRSLT